MSEDIGGAGSFAVRVFLDAEDRAWEVRAIRPLELDRRVCVLPGDHANGWLLFSLGLERRRFAPVPPQWERASELELQRWWVHAQPVVDRGTTARTAAQVS